jgi:epoxide hydrolase 4
VRAAVAESFHWKDGVKMRMMCLLAVAACTTTESDPCAEATATLATDWTDEAAADVLMSSSCFDDDDGGKADDGADVTTADLPTTLACGTTEPAFAMISVGDGVQLHTACQGSGPTIVFLHGWPEHWLTWKPIMAALAPRFRVIAPDLRGYNLSSRPAGEDSYTFDAYVRDTVALIREAGDAPVILVGHDVGGFAAWAIAHQHPELVRGLAIANASHPDVLRTLIANDPAQREALGFWSLLDRFRWPLVIGGLFYSQIMKQAFAHHSEPRSILTADEQAAYLASWKRSRLPWKHAMVTMIAWYRANLEQGPDPIGFPRDQHIAVPTLVMWGMHDVALLAEPNLAGLPAYVGKLRIERFAGAGHYVTHEVPDDVARLIAGLADDPEGFVR